VSLDAAGDAIKEITTHVENQVIVKLKAHHEQEIDVDFAALQDVCDASQDRAILALMQLQQRMITSGALENVTPPPLNPANALNRTSVPSTAHRTSNSASKIPDSMIGSPDLIDSAVRSSRRPISLSSPPLTPLETPFRADPSHRPESSLSRTSIESYNAAKRNAEAYKPMATTVTKTGFFGIVRRTKVEPITSPPDNPLVDEYLADALEVNAKRLSRTASINTSGTSIYEPDQTNYKSWQNPPQDHSPNGSPRPSISALSFDSVLSYPTLNREVLTLNRSIHSISPKDSLPNEMNKYAGFCKGAWRQQIGDTKRAMEERVRPGGTYNQAKYWQCKQCKFEGRLVPVNKKRNGYDLRVFKLVEGIQFRWEFMFKSHIAAKDADSNPTKATFGCIFCCSDGQGTPTFDGIQQFMNHLVEHTEHLPTGEVLYRMNCLVGRQAAVEEDFHINLISPEGGQF